jgi:hypothetical protein
MKPTKAIENAALDASHATARFFTTALGFATVYLFVFPQPTLISAALIISHHFAISTFVPSVSGVSVTSCLGRSKSGMLGFAGSA